MKILFLDDLNAGLYDSFLEGVVSPMFTQSLKYRDFLLKAMPHARAHYLCAVDASKILAILPLMSSEGPAGPVFNSLPFFGSHGGILRTQGVGDEAGRALLDAAKRLCIENRAYSLTIVESLFGSYSHTALGLIPTDERIGQVTVLPELALEEEVEESLMARFHKNTRTAIRKARSVGYDLVLENSREALNDLWALHTENMRSIGGQSKGVEVMDAIWSSFEPETDFQLYLAKQDSQTVSALLVFYYGDFVEYWMPVTKESHRPNQPLSLLIMTAMKDAVLGKQATYWNWGGTWTSQLGVYAFKSRWGTSDFVYRYFTEIFDEERLTGRDLSSLISDYPGFYVAPMGVEREDFV